MTWFEFVAVALLLFIIVPFYFFLIGKMISAGFTSGMMAALGREQRQQQEQPDGKKNQKQVSG